MKRRVVAHLHGGNYHTFYEQQSKFWQFLIKHTLLRLDKIAVLGHSLKSMFDFEIRLASKIVVIPNGIQGSVSPSQFTPKTLPVSKEEPISLLYLSNLIEFKGYLDVLESMSILTLKYHLKVNCYFGGKFLSEPRFDENIQSAEHAEKIFYEKIEKLCLNQRVKYEGEVGLVKKGQLLQESHF